MTHAFETVDIAILVTGGTLDKIHDTETESLTFSEDDETHLPQLLTVGRCYYPRVELLFKIDSLDMTDAHRQIVLDRIRNAPECRIIVTHGTGTLENTAKFLEGKVGDKTVVLTGAMRPFSLGRSDGGFNLGGALIAAQTLNQGVYGVMNGRVFQAKDLHKDTKLGRFDV